MDGRELIAMLRGAADGLERLYETEQTEESRKPDRFALLSAVALINRHEKRGAFDEDMRRIAWESGYDARGVAGLYNSGHLVWNHPDSRTTDPSKGLGRWVTQKGFDYLKEHGWKPVKSA